MKPIRLGVVGLGNIANSVHLPLWLKMKDQVRIIALCDTYVEKFEGVSKQFKMEKFYEDIDEMLEKENIDVIDICTPPDTHTDLCMKALKAGVNCIVEKPLATTVAATDQLIRVAKDNKVNLFVIHNYSFVPVLRKARNLVLSGEIGDILQVHVTLSLSARTFERELQDPCSWVHKLPGGLFGEIAPHPCYILVEFLNDEIKEVKTQMVKRNHYQHLIGDELQVLARTEKAIGSFSISLNSPTRKMIINLIGSKLWVLIDAEAQAMVKYPPISGSKAVFHRGMRALSDIFQRTNCLAGVSLNVIAGRYSPYVEGHRYLFSQSIRALRGQGTYPVSLEMVKNEVKVLENAFFQMSKPYGFLDGRDRASGARSNSFDEEVEY